MANHKTWVMGLAAIAIVTTACTVPVGAVDLPGLQALREDAGLTEITVSGPLRALADQAEADAPLLDVVQIEFDEQGSVVAFVILNMPEQGEQSDQEYAAVQFDTLRTAIEAMWDAALEQYPEAASMSVAFMQVRTLTTLDRGPAPVAWLLGGVTISLPDAARYLQGVRTVEAFQSFWQSDAVVGVPLNEPYAGTPNHPVRSLDA